MDIEQILATLLSIILSMRLQLNQIKFKLWLAFLFVSINLIVLAGLSFYYFQMADKLRRSENLVLQINVLVSKLISNDNLFFAYETSNPTFFAFCHSPYISTHDSLFFRIKLKLEELNQKIPSSQEDYNSKISTISLALDTYNVYYDSLRNKILYRGFKDYGLEGRMRSHVHQLEMLPNVPLVPLLSLRRHEKDFLLRHDAQYVENFQSLFLSLSKEYDLFKNPNPAQEHLSLYATYFMQIVELDMAMGLHNNTGLKKLLNEQTSEIEKTTLQIGLISHEFTEKRIQQGNIFFVVTVLFSLILSLVVGWFLAKNISDPIAHFSRQVYNFQLDKPEGLDVAPGPRDSLELIVLKQAFLHMTETLYQQYSEIKEKSDLLVQNNLSLNKLNKELDQFVYSASHDLKAPLSSLLGLIQILKLENKDPKYGIYLDMMKKNIQKMEAHIKEIINYAKNHQLENQWQSIALQEMVENIIEMLRYQEGAENIQLEMVFNEEKPLVSDHTRLNMILFNLISNAFKYYDPQKETKKISIHALVTEGEAVIEIIDNGIGISAEHLDKIFLLFYRASEKSTGSGLGLFIVKEAVAKLGGSILVDSTMGVGSRFTLVLPQHISNTPQRPAPTMPLEIIVG